MSQESDVKYIAYLKQKFNLADDELLQVFSISQQAVISPPTARESVEYEEEELVVEEPMNDESYEEILEESEEGEIFDEEMMDASYEEQVKDNSMEEIIATTSPPDPEAGGIVVGIEETKEEEPSREDERTSPPDPEAGGIVVGIEETKEEEPSREDERTAFEDKEQVIVKESLVQEIGPTIREDVPDDEARADEEEARVMGPVASNEFVPTPEQAPPIQEKDVVNQPEEEEQEEQEKTGRRNNVALILCCLLLFLVIAAGMILILIFVTDTIPTGRKKNNGPIRMAPYEPNNCDFSGQAQPNVISQCECDGQVTRIANSTRNRYNDLVSSLVPNIFPEGTSSINSCDPANLAVLWLSTGATIGNGLRLRQRYALANLYYATKGQQWKRDTGWLSDDNVCNWFGVKECNGDEVIAVELPGNSLDGQIPTQMSVLTNLGTLSLDKNFLRGTLPSGVLTIPALTQLTLACNRMTGSIPASVGQATGLQILLLNSNVFAGSLPTQLDRLTKLRALSLENNTRITGRIPSEFGRFTNLESLSISGTSIRATIPTSYGALTRLQELGIANTLVGGYIPVEFGRLTSLTSIDFAGSRFRQTIPTILGNLTQLSYLALDNNNFEGEIPPQLGDLTSLKTLLLNDNDLSGLLPSTLSNLTRLETLTIQGNPQLIGAVPAAVCQLRAGNLKTFISDCPGRALGIVCPIPACCTQCTPLS